MRPFRFPSPLPRPIQFVCPGLPSPELGAKPRLRARPRAPLRALLGLSPLALGASSLDPTGWILPPPAPQLHAPRLVPAPGDLAFCVEMTTTGGAIRVFHIAADDVADLPARARALFPADAPRGFALRRLPPTEAPPAAAHETPPPRDDVL